MKLFFRVIFSLLMASTVACTTRQLSTDHIRQIGDISPTAGHEAELVGVWKSNGYGYLIEVDNEANRFFSYTPDFCLEEDIEDETISDFYDFYYLSEDSQIVQFWGSIDPYPYQFQRIEVVPDLCNTPFPDTPIVNLNAFISYFSQHYAFFDLYGVDWEDETRAARAKITSNTSDTQLLEIMKHMLRNIKDGHVTIKTTLGDQRERFEANAPDIAQAIDRMAAREGKSSEDIAAQFHEGYWFTDIPKTLLRGEGTIIANRRIQYGIVGDEIGYIAFMNIGQFVDGEDSEGYGTNQIALDIAMEAAITQFNQRGVKAVIIDLSINYGGYDYLARSIAGRFTETRMAAYNKTAFDADDVMPFEMFIEPSKGAVFTGPVYLLTSNITLSAGEVTTMSLRALPNVMHVGQATRGALSDTLTKTLPNGWDITLSNEVYEDHNGIVWEGTGIVPEIEMPVFNPENPLEGHVETVRELIRLIHKPPTLASAP